MVKRKIKQERALKISKIGIFVFLSLFLELLLHFSPLLAPKNVINYYKGITDVIFYFFNISQDREAVNQI